MTYTQYVSANAKERFYSIVKPYSNSVSYYKDSIYAVVLPASLVQVPGKATLDTVAIGDSLSISAKLSSDDHFVVWRVKSGTGKFVDSSSTSTRFIPSSAKVELEYVTSSAVTYPISAKESKFNYYDHGSSTYAGYGIRTKFVAPKAGQYSVVLTQNTSSYVYTHKDSVFSSGYSSRYSTSSGVAKVLFSADSANAPFYFSFGMGSNPLRSEISVKVLKTVKVRADTVGYGYVYVGTSSRNYDSTYVVGDSIQIRAYAYSSSRFSHWEKVSGSCTIVDSTQKTTYARLKGDCNLRAVFTDGIVYDITGTPKEYSVEKNYYTTNYDEEVRFRFVAPKSGVYAIAVTRPSINGSYNSSERLYLYQYSSSSFGSYNSYKYNSGVVYDSISVNAGDTVYYKFKNSGSSADKVPFWISYSTGKGAIFVESDHLGSATPASGYPSAWLNVAYPISAAADSGYRFNRWRVVSGSATIADSLARATTVSTTDTAHVKAMFKKGAVQTLSTQAKNFSFQNHYFSDYTGSAIYFKWTAPDTSWRMISFVFSTPMEGTLYFYGNDSTFTTSKSSANIKGNFQEGFKPSKKNLTFYWKFVSATAYNYSGEPFSALVATPYVLVINSSSKGFTNPMGSVAVAPGMDTLAYAIPYGGYVFDSWVSRKGSVTIEDPKSARTRIKPNATNCVVEATYTLDFSVEPQLTISSLDLNNHPGVCATVSVTDANSGRAIVGLDSSNFILYQDKKSVPVQITSVEKIGGVSVALVVDESGSMSNSNKMVQAKESIRQFINEMGPYDRTAIVGFTGGSRYTVHQTMTSNRSLLLSAVDRLTDNGSGTNINQGAYYGVEQVMGETNPTAVIVFSDGANNDDVKSISDVVSYANGLNTTIYSIGLMDQNEHPLKDLAEGTGGTYTYAPTAVELAGIYSNIRSAVQARYVLCYRSPDAILDGDTHQVVIKGTFLNKTARDTAYWNENLLPPVVTLTDSTRLLIGRNQPEKQAITIQVKVVSKKDIASVYIYTRTSSSKKVSFVSSLMTHVSGDLWSFTIPSSSVVAPGIDFYVVATDQDGFTGKSPSVPNPAREPYTIPVKNEVPKITSMLDACIDTTSGQGVFDSLVTDDDGVSEVTLFYKNDISVVFETENFKRSGTDKSAWYAEIPASEFVNSEVEFYVRALDSKGASARWNKFKNSSIPACKDSRIVEEVQDTIRLVNASEKGKAIGRETESLSATLITESFSREVDTVLVDLSCLESGDMENNLKMVEVSPGQYELLKEMKKDERTAKRNDGRISCTATDTLVISYKDPLFGTVVSDSAAMSVLAGVEYRFMNKSCIEDLDSAMTTLDVSFCLLVSMESPSLTLVDTLMVTLFTDAGDSLEVKAIETDAYTSEFKYKGYFTYVNEKKAQKASVLDAVMNFDGKSNRVKIQAGVKSDKSKLKNRDSLIVNSDYEGAELAEIYDSDLDGRADSIRIRYRKPLDAKIEGIDTLYWNKAGEEWREVKKSELVLEKDHKWLSAALEEPFEYGKTAEDASAKPYLLLTKNKGDIMQKMRIKDRIGAVPALAVKHPGEISISDYLDASDVLPPDTLVITLSEPIRNLGEKSAWKHLFRYSKKCSDSTSQPINAEAPEIDSTGMVWTFILKDYNLSVDNCIRTNPEAEYEDLSHNSMGRGGIEVTGKDGSVYLYEVAGNPALSGLDKNPEWIPEGGKKWVTQPDSISSIRVWTIAPYHAFVTIYDGLSNVVTSFEKDFGFKGEMEQEIRGNEKNHYKVGFLGWNQRSSEGRKVSTGVYIWRIDFKFDDGHSEFRLLKTGLKRRNDQ